MSPVEKSIVNSPEPGDRQSSLELDRGLLPIMDIRRGRGSAPKGGDPFRLEVYKRIGISRIEGKGLRKLTFRYLKGSFRQKFLKAPS